MCLSFSKLHHVGSSQFDRFSPLGVVRETVYELSHIGSRRVPVVYGRDQFVKHIITKHIMVFKLKDFCWVFITIHWINIKHPFQNGCAFCSHSYFFEVLNIPIPLPSPPFKRKIHQANAWNVFRIFLPPEFFPHFLVPRFFFTHRNGELPSSGNLQTWDTAVANAGEMLVGMSLDRNDRNEPCDGCGVVGRGLVSSLDLFFPVFWGILVAGFFAKHKERCTLVT